MDLKGIGVEGMDPICVTLDGDQWRILVNTVMDLLESIKDGEFLG
jgi:hypothetical protein